MQTTKRMEKNRSRVEKEERGTGVWSVEWRGVSSGLVVCFSLTGAVGRGRSSSGEVGRSSCGNAGGSSCGGDVCRPSCRDGGRSSCVTRVDHVVKKWVDHLV
ncbi:hypothetical protein BaRGS_00021836 [Batillaria attramentaria]|uniref:Uncharacterized protein n=1 Tax=Batillaria attramentaria TaxID=370345 RepID=A0ABD0KJ02_9CAEN